MQYGNLWISRIEDCDENEGGYFCQVYADSDMQYEIDAFCICPDMCDCTDEKEIEKYIAEYAKMYSLAEEAERE